MSASFRGPETATRQDFPKARLDQPRAEPSPHDMPTPYSDSPYAAPLAEMGVFELES